LRSTSGFAGVSFGAAPDKPAAAGYDGDGKVDIAVWRTSDGTFYILRSANNSFVALQSGASDDLPVASTYI
jgi:hypothetical protein